MLDRVGTRSGDTTQWPTYDVLGQPYTRAAASEYGIGEGQFVMVSTGTAPKLAAQAIETIQAALAQQEVKARRKPSAAVEAAEATGATKDDDEPSGDAL